MITLWSLFAAFLRIGATGFGGMAALLALIEEQIVKRRKWATPEEFAEGWAISQMLPGPIAVDTATYLGYRLRGWRGAVVTTLGLVLPAFLLMLALTPFYLGYGQLPQLDGVFRGIGAAVVALVMAAGYRLGRSSLRSVRSVLIALAAFVGLTFFHIDAVLLIVLCGAMGVLFCRPAAKAESPPQPPAEPAAAVEGKQVEVGDGEAAE
jgi:chromate transporter